MLSQLTGKTRMRTTRGRPASVIVTAVSLMLAVHIASLISSQHTTRGGLFSSVEARSPGAAAPLLSPLVRSRQFTTTAVATSAPSPIQLDEGTWRWALEGEWLLLATAYGCRPCKEIEPEWRQLAELAADEDHRHLGLRVGALDFTSNGAMSARFQVRLPTILHAKDGVFRHYPGPGRDHLSLMRFVQEQGWKMIEPMALSFLPRGSPSSSSFSSANSQVTPQLNKQQQQQVVLLPTSQQQATGGGSPTRQQAQYQQQYHRYMTASTVNPYTNATHMLLLDLRQKLIDRGVKFDEHFRSLLTQSKISLNSMFLDTYGMWYEKNTQVFTNMYESLEQYYATGEVKLTQSMQNFFEQLYQKVFQVFHHNSLFSPTYLKCATQQLIELRPFRDAPEKLTADIRNAFVAARTLNWALNAGIDIIKSAISLGQPLQCTSMINERLLKGGSSPTTTRNAAAAAAADHQMPSCKVPCLGYCEQVISRCIGRSNLEHLNERWRAYALALAELAKKLTSQYNIITIIGPIDVQISEAIMNFQDNATIITDQVKRVCGEFKQSMLGGGGGGPRMASSGFSNPGMAAVSLQSRPMPSRLGKRAAPAPDRMPSYPMDSAQSSHGNQQRRQLQQQQQQMQHLQPSTHMGQPSAHSFEVETSHGLFDHSTLGGATGGAVDNIEPPNLPLVQMRKKSPLIINDIRDFILSTKNFWSQLPGSVCTSAIIAIDANLTGAGCGSASSAYSSQNNNYLRRNVASTQNCFQEALEFTNTNNQDLRFRNETLRQIARLELVHSRIQDALHGVEIDWTAGSSSSGASYPVVGGIQPTQNQQQPVRQPPQLAVQQQPGEDVVTNGSPDEDDNDDDPEAYEGSGGDIDDQEPEDSDSTTTITTDHTDSDECAEDDDPLCPPVDTTTQPGDSGLGNQDGNDDQAGTTSNPVGASAMPPFADGDIDTNGKPPINNDLDVVGNHIISAADQSAQKSDAAGSALHQLFVIQKFSLVQLLSTCVLVLTLSVVTHNDHHLGLVHH